METEQWKEMTVIIADWMWAYQVGLAHHSVLALLIIDTSTERTMTSLKALLFKVICVEKLLTE